MKGVDAAVATILLLMITISLIGFAFVWFNRLAKQSAQTLENQTLESQKKSGMRISVISYTNSNVVVRNIGTENIPADSVVVVNSTGTILGKNTNNIAVNSVETISMSPNCNSGDDITVSAPGGEDYFTCP